MSLSSFYNKKILPKFLNFSMRSIDYNGTRSQIASKAKGTVLEIGFGSGFNLPFYQNIDKLFALEPSQGLYNMAADRISRANFPIQHLSDSAENIPLPDGSVDTVVSTWVLCSIPDVSKALREVFRVLKFDGKFIFVEHGLSPNRFYSLVQKTFTPISSKFTGNCHLDRNIELLIKEAGFRFERFEKFQEKGRPLMYSYRGVAVKKS